MWYEIRTYNHIITNHLTLISNANSEQFSEHIPDHLSWGRTKGDKGIGEDGGREEVRHQECCTRPDSLHSNGRVLRREVVLGTVLHQLKRRVCCRGRSEEREREERRGIRKQVFFQDFALGCIDIRGQSVGGEKLGITCWPEKKSQQLAKPTACQYMHVAYFWLCTVNSVIINNFSNTI